MSDGILGTTFRNGFQFPALITYREVTVALPLGSSLHPLRMGLTLDRI